MFVPSSAQGERAVADGAAEAGVAVAVVLVRARGEGGEQSKAASGMNLMGVFMFTIYEVWNPARDRRPEGMELWGYGP